jgi:putative FmdB family regulatory protein
MPRYSYQCENCNIIINVIHSIDEEYTDCAKCESKNTMKKLLSTPIIVKKNKHNKNNNKIGEITKEYIELNREILNSEKKLAKEKEHDPS